MKKTIQIEGMMCEGCTRRVEQALQRLPGVSAQADLAQNQVTITGTVAPTDAILKQTIEDLGFDVTQISESGV